MRPWIKWGLIGFVGLAGLSGVEAAFEGPPKPRPVLTLAQHKAVVCQSLWQTLGGASGVEAYERCGDPGPANAIDPYVHDASKGHR
jgi:hypothetical protein